ncbi:hypothetical protein RUM43_009462 [Polyplax serrata]|uniref:Uncharacterized protein n=1 Tax=Polyplax serrata TaxID=468196 RepID=A0AAN8NVG8_POLSC
MLSKISTKKKGECTCVSIKLDDRRNGDQQPPVVDIECSSHPGICSLDENGVCTKRESAIHCANLSLKSLGETFLMQKEAENQKKCDSKSSCNRKVHCYKIDLNNSEDTGLEADKQCQTCGPDCSPATCSSRARQYLINWDKARSKIFFFLALAFIIWLSVYSALSLTSNL